MQLEYLDDAIIDVILSAQAGFIMLWFGLGGGFGRQSFIWLSVAFALIGLGYSAILFADALLLFGHTAETTWLLDGTLRRLSWRIPTIIGFTIIMTILRWGVFNGRER